MTEGSLKEASDAFGIIHDKMWEIHHMVTGENEGRLLERKTRDKIMEIFRHCQMLDHRAADNIKAVLDKHNTI